MGKIGRDPARSNAGLRRFVPEHRLDLVSVRVADEAAVVGGAIVRARGRQADKASVPRAEGAGYLPVANGDSGAGMDDGVFGSLY